MSQVPAAYIPPVLTISQPDAISVLTEMLSAEQFSVYNFPSVSVPRESIRFTVETEDGEKELTEITGVILEAKTSKAYWAKAYGSGTIGAPDCRSDNGKIGVGNPGGNCLICPWNQYGTAPGGDGKACKENRILFFLMDGDMIPTIITLPPTSIKPWMNFQMSLMKKANPSYGVRTKLTLEKVTNKSGKRYVQVNFQSIGKLGEEDLAAVRSYRRAMEGMFASYNAAAPAMNEGSAIDISAAQDAGIVCDSLSSPFGDDF